VQICCVPWKTMDFMLEAQLPYLTVAACEEIIRGRHGDPIANLVLYRDDLAKENVLPAGSASTLENTTKIFYDYYPPLDPFKNRPTACEVYRQNPLLKTACEEAFDPPNPEGAWKAASELTVMGGVRTWSKTAEYDPHTMRLMEEAAAAAAAKAKAEADALAAKIAAEKAEAKRIADEKAAEKARKAAEKKAQEEQEAKEAAEAEAARLKKLEEEAMNDPVKRAELERKKAEAEAAQKKAEAEAALAALPKRSKGGAVGIFLGGTTKEYYGLDQCTPENPYLCIPVEKILAEITDKGKISDLYNSKDFIQSYAGDPKEILFCKDEDELYGDNGFIICLQDADKKHFMAHIAAGNGIPKPI